jgi:tRNA G46 methylase TrmB
VNAFHIYFPDPWPKSRHSKHRLFSPSLIDGLARCLEPKGRVYVATDVGWYFEHITGLFVLRGFRLVVNGAGDAQRTNFGRRFAEAGMAIKGGCFQLRNAGDALTCSSSQVTVDP